MKFGRVQFHIEIELNRNKTWFQIFKSDPNQF